MLEAAMPYTIAVKPGTIPGRFAATSSDGHTFTTSTPLLNGARYWLDQGAPSSATIITIWSSNPEHWALRSTVGYAASKTVREGSRGTPYLATWTPFPSD
jgi:hypothetical protein